MELSQQITLIKDGVSIMIPVITGFIVLYGGSLGKKTQNLSKNYKYPWKIAIISLSFSVISLFICFGTFSICIRASFGEPAIVLWVIEANPKELVLYAKHYLSAAYICFGIAVSFATIFYYRNLKNRT
jgi:hypothetical protein